MLAPIAEDHEECKACWALACLRVSCILLCCETLYGGVDAGQPAVLCLAKLYSAQRSISQPHIESVLTIISEDS